MSRITGFDPSRAVDLNFRINREGTVTIPVYGSDELAFPLIYEDFQFTVKKFAGDRTNVIDLSVGSGLSIDDNELTITITQALSNLPEGEYYYELIQIDDNQTWLNGTAFFYNSRRDAENDDISLNLTTEPIINVYINR